MTTTRAPWRKRLAGWTQALLSYQPGTIGHALYAYKYAYDLGDEALMRSARCTPQRFPALLETRLPAALSLETVTPIAQAVGCDAVGLLVLLNVATTGGAPEMPKTIAGVQVIDRATVEKRCFICGELVPPGDGVYREIYRLFTPENAKEEAHPACLEQVRAEARRLGVPLATLIDERYDPLYPPL